MRMPIRKPGKYTFKKSDPYITEEKYKKLKVSLERLKKIERPPAIKEVKQLAAMGDFSENAEYQIAKGKLRGINSKILRIEGYLNNAKIIRAGKNKETIQLGHSVTIETTDKSKTYKILGSAETNPTSGVISHNSPLGSKLLGKKVGDLIEIKKGNKVINYKIINIK